MSQLHNVHFIYKFKDLLFIAICIAAGFACENKKTNIDTSGNLTPVVEKIITVYGSKNCDHCNDFRNKLDSANLKYEFKDAEANEQYYKELLLKIQQANFKGYVSFPVLEIDNKIYVKPSFEEFMSIISE